MPQLSPSRRAEKIIIRLPDGMRPRLAERAKSSMRSVNSEVVMILANALGDESKAATGSSPGKANPAAVTHESACQGAPATR